MDDPTNSKEPDEARMGKKATALIGFSSFLFKDFLTLPGFFPGPCFGKRRFAADH